MGRKIMVWGGLALLDYFIVFRPDLAGQTFVDVRHAIVDIAESIGGFVSRLIS